MNLNEIIKNRRATPPKFMAKKEVDKELILNLLENANWAPNHKNTEPWRFIVFQEESKQKLAKSKQKLLGFFFVGHIAMEYPSPGRGPVFEKVDWK